jgi:hypothetical protein
MSQNIRTSNSPAGDPSCAELVLPIVLVAFGSSLQSIGACSFTQYYGTNNQWIDCYKVLTDANEK